ncbi:MAG: RluA family pseudouridine synthase [Desulfobacterales bacterium]|nr:RluA family pseudouridine synthase [Deltaproteobacteria bacterium]NNK94446.1 RluA family pseudouridine synthase [Desulfobacterales bacterium]
MDLEILYEDNHLIALNKPAGLLTQGDRSGDPCLLDSLKDYIKKRDFKPGNVFVGMVQRLDRPVSGVVIFAKTSKAAGRLSECIRKRQITKLYLALTESNGIIDYSLNRWSDHTDYLFRKGNKTHIAKQAIDGSKKGKLRLQTLHVGKSHALHRVHLVTGRKHQIRAQLSHMGIPIAGDRKYGSSDNFPVSRGIGLHAYYCSVDHPVRAEQLNIITSLPDDLLHPFNSEEKKLIVLSLKDVVV